MESSSTSTSRFRFRDLPEMENSSQFDTASDASSVVSSDPDDGSDLQSMTTRGIKHLCSELLELKAASDVDFHSHIFANYSSFVRVFKEVGRMESELMELRNHVLTQKRLVNDLVDGIYSKVLAKESMDSVIEGSEWDEPLPISELEVHANDVMELLDILLSENRIDEALDILELEDENFQRMQFEEDCPVEELRLFESAILERKGLLTQKLTMVAENPRISAAELQKALVGLCRLGDDHLATSLLLEYYHSRIASGIHNLKASMSLLDRVYIRELSKFVFSMISQAARSFVMLYGETSPYAPEVLKWTREETKVFAACFDKYVKSISEVSGGLSAAVEAVQFAISFCSLLETQRLVLRPYLIKHISPCIEDVLNIHLDHFTKVIGIFTATDTWVLGRYLVSGITNERWSSMVVGQQPEYCLLTNSGRKFVTLLQKHYVTDGIGKDGNGDTCSMPIDGNSEEFKFGNGLKLNGGVTHNSPLPSSEIRSVAPDECMTTERDKVPLVQSLLDSPPSFGDPRGSDNDNSFDQRSDQISDRSLIREQMRPDSSASDTDGHLRELKRQKKLDYGPVSGTNCELSQLTHEVGTPSIEYFTKLKQAKNR